MSGDLTGLCLYIIPWNNFLIKKRAGPFSIRPQIARIPFFKISSLNVKCKKHELKDSIKVTQLKVILFCQQLSAKQVVVESKNKTKKKQMNIQISVVKNYWLNYWHTY